jgi:proteic killer suppression protein
MKIKGYKNNKLKKQLNDASECKRAYGEIAKKIFARMEDIRASPNLAVLLQIPAANCHQLKGDRKAEWAVNISVNYRLIFILEHDPMPYTDDGSIDAIMITDIFIIEIVDYH